MSVAIIGLLAAVSLPAYQMYSNRAAFSEVLLAVGPYRTFIVVAAEAGRFSALTDINEGTNGIPDFQQRTATTHGIHVHDGEIRITWRDDGSALDGVDYTLTATTFTTPIQWVAGGSCVSLGLC